MKILCPACHSPAKESTFYKGVYVCRCLGRLEDISIIKQKLIAQPLILNFGHISWISPRKDVLGNIDGTDGKTYHFDSEKYPYPLGSFIRFKSLALICQESNLAVACAEELELIKPID